MAWTATGPCPKACRFYANVLRKLVRTRGAPITAEERRMASAMAEVFERLQKEQAELAAFETSDG